MVITKLYFNVLQLEADELTTLQPYDCSCEL